MAKTAQITLDKPRIMKFDLYAQMKFQEATGRDVDDLEETATDMATMIWACLQWEYEPNGQFAGEAPITVYELAQMIDIDNIEKVAEVLESIVSKPTPLAPSGSSDGPSPDTTSD